jgi:hypothetical protein
MSGLHTSTTSVTTDDAAVVIRSGGQQCLRESAPRRRESWVKEDRPGAESAAFASRVKCVKGGEP